MSGFVVCLGETLFDSTPAGIFLGGAPGNVAVHLSQLGAKVEFASRVGDDLLGREARRRLSSYGVGVSLLQSETTPPRSGGGGGAGDGPGGCETGFVLCEIAPNGDATYTFNEPAAWDVLAAEPARLCPSRRCVEARRRPCHHSPLPPGPPLCGRRRAVRGARLPRAARAGDAQHARLGGRRGEAARLRRQPAAAARGRAGHRLRRRR